MSYSYEDTELLHRQGQRARELADEERYNRERIVGYIGRVDVSAYDDEDAIMPEPVDRQAFAAVANQMSPLAVAWLAWAMELPNRDYRPYFSMLTPMVWADKARLTPDQWMGVCEFVHARGLRREDVF